MGRPIGRRDKRSSAFFSTTLYSYISYIADHQACIDIYESMPKSSVDVELATPKKEFPNGFASVADFIAKDQDNTSTIYRRFDRLAARNLLYLQSKLQKLEAIQDELDKEVLLTSGRRSKRAATSWEDFEDLARTGEDEKRRMDMAEELQRTMKAYRKSTFKRTYSGSILTDRQMRRFFYTVECWI